MSEFFFFYKKQQYKFDNDKFNLCNVSTNCSRLLFSSTQQLEIFSSQQCRCSISNLVALNLAVPEGLRCQCMNKLFEVQSCTWDSTSSQSPESNRLLITTLMSWYRQQHDCVLGLQLHTCQHQLCEILNIVPAAH